MDMKNSTLITLCWDLYEQGMPKARIAERLGKNRETIHIWINNVERYGLLPFLERYEQAYIESFNRTMRKECLGWNKYHLRDLKKCTEIVELFLKRYHYHRPHMGSGMR